MDQIPDKERLKERCILSQSRRAQTTIAGKGWWQERLELRQREHNTFCSHLGGSIKRERERGRRRRRGMEGEGKREKEHRK